MMLFALSADAQTYYKSTARVKAQIDTLFPFDIPLLASRGSGDTLLTRSDVLLKSSKPERPVVMLFWLTTCGPCHAELAAISERYASWQEKYDFDFVPISLDFSGRREAYHTRAATYPWTSYWDYDREFPMVMPGGLNGMPQLFVYDRNGQIILYRKKYRPEDLQLLEDVLARDASRDISGK